MSNLDDPDILRHIQDTLGIVRHGLCQAREKVADLDSKTYELIDKAMNLSAAAEGAISDHLDTMSHQVNARRCEGE
jgi:hypothetical protein